MEIITNPTQLMQAFGRYAFTGAPAELAERLQTLPGSECDRLCTAADLLYAHRDLLDEAGLTIMAQLFAYAKLQNWSAFDREDRCQRIVDGVKRDLGKPGEWPDPEDDPKPDTRFREDGADWRPKKKPEPEAPADE